MFTVQAGSFYPAPKVTSAVVRLDIRPTPAVQVRMRALTLPWCGPPLASAARPPPMPLRQGWACPRQQVAQALQDAGLDPRVRPEQLTLEDFAAVDAALRAGR